MNCGFQGKMESEKRMLHEDIRKNKEILMRDVNQPDEN
jgi:hypothetical protein